MKLFLKISLGFIALILIAVVGFALTFNPNDYKDDIVTLVKDKTGRTLSINGDISLSLFPWIGLDLGAIEISNAKGFGKQPLAKMSHLQVRAKLWPLLKKQLEADTVVIEGLTLNLAKNKKGLSNWDDLIQNKKQVKSKAKPAAKTSTNANNESTQVLAAIALNGLKIKDAQFNWHDKQNNQNISIKNVQLSLGQLKPNTKIPFEIQFNLEEKSVSSQVKFETEITFSPDFKQFSFYDTDLTSKLKLAALKKHLSPSLSSPLITLNLNKQTFNSKKLQLSLNTFKLQTEISAKKLFSTPYINGKIVIDSFNPRSLAKDLAITLPQMQGKNVLTKLSAQINLQGSLKHLKLTNIELSLDNTSLVGSAVYKPMPASSSVNLVVDQISLDRYFLKTKATQPSAKNKAQTVKKASAKEKDEPVLIPVALLNAVNLDSRFKIKKIQVKNTHWTDFNFVTHSKNGRIQIKPLSIQGYDATIKSNFIIKAEKNNARLSGNLNVKNLKAGKLLNDFMGKDKLSGQTSIVASFNTSGVKLSQLKKNLNGTLKLNLNDGTLKGFDLNHQLKVLDAKIKTQPIPATPKPEETKIAKLSASATIKKGRLNNKDLRASTPLSRIAGRGTVDIVKEKINYVATMKFTSSTDLKSNTSFEKMKSLPLDIVIKGPFNNLSIKPDFKKALASIVKKELKKQERKIKEKVKKDIKKELEKKLGNELKNLFKL